MVRHLCLPLSTSAPVRCLLKEPARRPTGLVDTLRGPLRVRELRAVTPCQDREALRLPSPGRKRRTGYASIGVQLGSRGCRRQSTRTGARPLQHLTPEESIRRCSLPWTSVSIAPSQQPCDALGTNNRACVSRPAPRPSSRRPPRSGRSSSLRAPSICSADQ